MDNFINDYFRIQETEYLDGRKAYAIQYRPAGGDWGNYAYDMGHYSYENACADVIKHWQEEQSHIAVATRFLPVKQDE